MKPLVSSASLRFARRFCQGDDQTGTQPLTGHKIFLKNEAELPHLTISAFLSMSCAFFAEMQDLEPPR
jgi:hypothetical protein